MIKRFLDGRTLDVRIVVVIRNRQMKAGSMLRWSAILVTVAIAAPNVGLGQIYGDCLAPLSPEWALAGLPKTVESGRLAQDEVAVYFAAASKYLTCIDDERARVMAEAQHVTDLFNEYLGAR